MAGNMRRYVPKDNDGESEKPRSTTQGHGPCEVYGCPMQGHIHTGNWNCRYHWNKEGDALSRITLALNTHLPDFRWMDNLRMATVVDYDSKEVHKKSPYGFEPKDHEKFVEYKARILAHIDQLLGNKKREIIL